MATPKFPKSLEGVGKFNLTLDTSLIQNDQGPRGFRSVSNSPCGIADVEWQFIETDYAIFRSFFKNVLLNGNRLFEIPIPSEFGIIPFVVKFTAPGYKAKRNGFNAMVVSAALEMRGLPAEVVECTCAARPRLTLSEIEPGEPIVYGSGGRSIIDSSGHIFTTYLHATGVQMRIYNPLTQSEITEPIVVAFDEDWSSANTIHIVYHKCEVFISIGGNTYSTSDFSIVNQFDGCSLELLGAGDTDYLGAVGNLGVISNDENSLYISFFSGVGNGTFVILPEPPFIRSLPGVENTSWVYNFIYNKITFVRAYTGYGTFVDLRGAVNSSVEVASYFSTSHLQGTRLLNRDGYSTIFLMNCRTRGLISVDTISGAIIEFMSSDVGNPLLLAIYYSPDTDTLYAECADDSLLDNQRVLAFDATTAELKATYTEDICSIGLSFGDTIYIGNETFVGSEYSLQDNGRLWQISFGWR